MVSLRRPYANSICSIFPLCMESNAQEKSMNSRVVLRSFAGILLMIQWIVQIYEVMEQFFFKSHSDFPKIFLNFRSHMIEKQRSKNFSNYSSKSNVSVVLSDSKIAFLGEREDAAFCPFLNCVSFIDTVA